jgi:hypothetical protein
MSACKACGQTYRRGTRALVQFPRGSISTTVCPKCAAKGLLIVARVLPPVKVEKIQRADDVERVIRMLRTYASAARAVAKAEGERNEIGLVASGRAEGLESALETLRRETGR